jgi:Golgi SNAP receptor complex protein 1
MSKSWGTLRAELRLLEHETETLFTSDAPTRAHVDAQLSQRRSVLDQLAACLEQQTKPGNKAMHLDRHREILAEHEVEARRVLQLKQEAADRRNLLGNVNEDIRKFKGNAAGEEGAMLQERDRIESSHTMADSVLACVTLLLPWQTADRQTSFCDTR